MQLSNVGSPRAGALCFSSLSSAPGGESQGEGSAWTVTGVQEQKYVQGRAATGSGCRVKAHQVGVGSGVACVSAARRGEASNNVLRNLDFDYVGNSDHLFVNRVSAIFRLSFRHSPLVGIVEDNLGGTSEEAGRPARKLMPPHR